MNAKKVIFVSIPILIVIFSIVLIQIESSKDNEILNIIEEEQSLNFIETIDKTENEILSEISEKYEKIENDYEYDEFFSRDREWEKSGPFSIDRTEYALGEKIFFRAEEIAPSENGQIVFLRTLNQTHYKVWTSYEFDGMEKYSFNIYFEPAISKTKNICSKDYLVGKWVIVFRNTNYENLYFKIIDKIVPGDEDKFSKIVC